MQAGIFLSCGPQGVWELLSRLGAAYGCRLMRWEQLEGHHQEAVGSAAPSFKPRQGSNALLVFDVLAVDGLTVLLPQHDPGGLDDWWPRPQDGFEGLALDISKLAAESVNVLWHSSSTLLKRADLPAHSGAHVRCLAVYRSGVLTKMCVEEEARAQIPSAVRQLVLWDEAEPRKNYGDAELPRVPEVGQRFLLLHESFVDLAALLEFYRPKGCVWELLAWLPFR